MDNNQTVGNQNWEWSNKKEDLVELPKVNRGLKLVNILAGIGALLLVATVAAASYFVSNRISGRTAIAPNAPESKPLASLCPPGTTQCGPSSDFDCCSSNQTCSNHNCYNKPTPTSTPVPTPKPPTPTSTPQPPSTPTCGTGLSCGANPSGCSTCKQPGGGNTCCCPSGKTIVNNVCTSPSACSSGTSRCKTASTIENCVNGSWQAGSSCVYGCSNGSCNPNPNACTSGTSRCKTASTIENCVGGVWQVGQSCVNGCVNGSCSTTPTCGTGLSCGANPSGCSTCKQPGGGNTCCCPSGKTIVNNVCTSASACTGSQSRCKTAATIETCVNGSWQVGQSCVYGCNNGTCNPNPNACTGSQSRCKTAATIETCVNGIWQAGQSCVYGCNNGTCNPNPNACTGSQSRCRTAATIETCVNGIWQVGQSCVNGCNNGVCNSAKCDGSSTGGCGGANPGASCSGGTCETQPPYIAKCYCKPAAATPTPTSSYPNCGSGLYCGSNPSGCSICRQASYNSLTCCCPSGKIIVGNSCVTPGTPPPTVTATATPKPPTPKPTTPTYTPTPTPANIVPNCANITGQSEMYVDEENDYTATFLAAQSGGLTEGEIFYSKTSNAIDVKDINPLHRAEVADGGTVTGTFKPTESGHYWLRCRAWNATTAECRPPSTVDGAPRYPCAGPGFEMLVEVKDRPIAPMCVVARMYGNSDGVWKEITDMTKLESGTVVRFAVTGNLPSQAKARFKINGGEWNVSQTKMKVDSVDFYYIEQTLRSGSYLVESEIL